MLNKKASCQALLNLLALLLLASPRVSGQLDIQNGLVAYYPFNSNTLDESNNSNHGTNHGAILTTDRFGNIDAAYSFNGIDQYISIADHTTLQANSAISISLWINPTGVGSGTGSNNGGNILNKEGEYEIARLGDEEIAWSLANTNPGWWSWKYTGYFANLDNWVHLVLTYDSEIEETNIYANGEKVKTIEASGLLVDALTSQNELWIGGRSNISQFFNGKIDDIGIYNRALNRHEVRLLYKAGSEETLCSAYGEGADFLLGRWEGIFNQYACNINSSYEMVAIIENSDGVTFEGRLEWPSLGAATTMDGYVDGEKVFFFERTLIGGNEIVLNGIYESQLIDCCHLTGFWYVEELQANCSDPQTLIDGGNYSIEKTVPICLPTCEISSAIETTICEGEDYEGYDTSGIYIDTLISLTGCDSVRTLELSVLSPVQGHDTILLNQGDSHLWQDITINTDTSLCRTFTGSNGCDSLHCRTIVIKEEVSPCLSNKQANIWYFGHYSGLDFNTSPPTVLTDGQANTFEGVATISDEYGKLLFYTDGKTVWNKNHQPMPNGTGLLGNPSATQSGIIVPVPDNDHLFYVFTVDAWENSFANGLQYSIVDLRLADGLGDIREKNQLLMARSSERICGVFHANNRDVWVIGKEWGSNTYKAFLVTDAGLEIGGVTSEIGSLSGDVGYLKPSSDGKKIACADGQNTGFEVFEFDNANGKLSNPILLQSPSFNGAYGVEFSLDGNILYGTSVEVPAKVFQFNLEAGDANAIVASTTILSTNNILYKYGAMQMGPDGKIYVTSANQWPTPAFFSSLSVIEFPDRLGVDCNFQEDIVDVSPGHTRLGLPTFIQSYLNSPILTILGDNNMCLNSTSTLTITLPEREGESIEWIVLDDKIGIEQENERSVDIKAIAEGTSRLVVSYSNFCLAELRDTISIEVLPKMETVSTINICEGEDYEFGGQTYRISGTYTDTLQDVNGCDSFSILTLEVLPKSYTNIVAQMCEGEVLSWNNLELSVTGTYEHILQNVQGCDSIVELNLTVYPIQRDTVMAEICQGTSYQWQGETYAASGIYTAVSQTPQGCNDESTLVLMVSPTYEQFIDTFICGGEQFQFQGQILTSTGIYSDTLTSTRGCDSILGINLTVLPIPEIGIIGDSIICSGSTNLLVASESYPSYSWSTGSSARKTEITFAGNYELTITDGKGCTAVTSHSVSTSSIDEILFETQAPSCPGEKDGFIEIVPLGDSYSYTYQLNTGPASNNSLFENLSSGSYKIAVKNQYGCELDTTLFLQESVYDIELALAASSSQIKLGDSIFLEVLTNIEDPTIKWFPDDPLACDTCLTLVSYPLVSTTYQIRLVYQGCILEEQVAITVSQKDLFYVPNAFTPNNDGTNDYFRIYPSKAVREIIDFRLFSRWGELVYQDQQLNAVDKGWDGRYNGKALNSGIYLYVAKIIFENGREELVKGDVLLSGY